MILFKSEFRSEFNSVTVVEYPWIKITSQGLKFDVALWQAEWGWRGLVTREGVSLGFQNRTKTSMWVNCESYFFFFSSSQFNGKKHHFSQFMFFLAL